MFTVLIIENTPEKVEAITVVHVSSQAEAEAMQTVPPLEAYIIPGQLSLDEAIAEWLD